MNRTCLAALCGAGLLASALAPSAASAGTLRVDPIKVELTQSRKTASVTVRNEEAVPVTIRAYPMSWMQAGGEDRYVETSSVVVSPPVFTIPGGGTQTIRVGLRAPSAAGASYRLMVEEVPEATPGDGIRVALRLNLPLFAMLPAGSAKDLSWAAWQEPDGRWVIEAANGGQGYIRLEPAEASAATGVADASGLPLGTVLPNSRRRWVLGDKPTVADPARFQQIVRRSDDAKHLASLRKD